MGMHRPVSRARGGHLSRPVGAWRPPRFRSAGGVLGLTLLVDLLITVRGGGGRGAHLA